MILTTSTDGSIFFWNYKNAELIHKYSVKSSMCIPAVTDDQECFCIGNDDGDIFAFSLGTGKQIAIISHRRSTRSIRSCALSKKYFFLVYIAIYSMLAKTL
jgi:WD40 repeat protein